MPVEPLRRRAAMALLLTIGFFALALGVAGSLALVAYADYAWSKTSHPLLIIVCSIGSIMIVWSILPRWERFKKPGTRVKADRQPRLFAEVSYIAKSVRQRIPSEIYLTLEMNASVFRRGGILDIFTRRVMTLGLPLLCVLMKAELRGVLAHEFGHFHHGETTLGPWLYRVRAAMERTVDALSDAESILRFPFLWYARLFVRITHATSRQQELAADELAAKVAGPETVVSGLKKIHGAAIYYTRFVNDDMLPALRAGLYPPMLEGLQRFLVEEHVAKGIEKCIYEELKAGALHPFDTHPILRERVATLRKLGGMRPLSDSPPAIALIDDLSGIEKETLHIVFDRDPGELKPIAWTDLAYQYYVPTWTEHFKEYRSSLKGRTPLSVPDLIPTLEAFGVKLNGAALPKDRAEGLASYAIGVGLALALCNSGWVVQTSPGAPIALHKDGRTIEPFELIPQLIDGKIDAEAWRKRCDEWGIATLDLG